MDLRLVSRKQVLKSGRALAVGRWAVLFAIRQSDAFALSDKVELMVTDVHAVDREAVSFPPGLTNLQVAKPSVAIKCALFLLIV